MDRKTLVTTLYTDEEPSIEHLELNYVLGQLLYAVHPELTSSLTTAPADKAHGNMHLKVRGSLNTGTMNMMQDVIQHILHKSYGISYTINDTSLNRKAEIQKVFNDLVVNGVPRASLGIYGPITRQEADVLVAAQKAENEHQWQESQRQEQQVLDDSEAKRHEDSYFAD